MQAAHGIEREIFTQAVVSPRSLALGAGSHLAEPIEDVDNRLQIGIANSKRATCRATDR